MILKKLFICLFPLSISCATNSQSRWAAMGLAAPFGAGVGALTAPEDEKSEFHALAWGSTFVAIAAILGGYYYNDDEDLGKLRTEVEMLKAIKFDLIDEGVGYSNPLKKNKNSVKWKIYKIDQWVPGGKNIKYHRDLMIKKGENEK